MPGEHLGADRLLGLLEAVHRLAHDLQPRDRVLDVDGQRRAHRGEPVAELVVLVARADRDGHERAQLQPLGAHAARAQPLLQRAGDDGEHDVVDRAAERVLDLLDVASSWRTVTSRRCGPISTLSGVDGAGFRPAHTTSPRPSSASRVSCSAADGRVAAPTRARPSPRAGARAPRARRGRPSARRSAWAAGVHARSPCSTARGLGREVEEHGGEVDAGDAVDQRVVGLGDQREAPALQAVHEPQLPQRLGAVERLGVHARGERAQLRLRARARAAPCRARGTRG